MNMRTLAVRSVRANPVRFIATVLAVVVGTGFLAGTLVLKDSLNASLEANIKGNLAGVDAAVLGNGNADSAGGSTPGSTPSGTTPGSTQPSASGPRGGSGGGGPNTATGRNIQQGVDQDVPASVLTQVQGVDGVRVADGVLVGNVNVFEPDGSTVNENANAYRWTEPPLNPYRIITGDAPSASGEIAIDKRTADAVGLSVGSKLQLATASGQQEATVVGIATYGEAESSNSNGDVLVSDADAFAWLLGGKQAFTAIYVAAEPGTAPDQLVTAIGESVGPAFTVETGDQLRTDAAGGLTGFTDFLSTGLVIFAVIALFVSLFIIYNTFTIIVSQRTREFALLRALGARGAQVVRSVLIEAFLLGLGSSILGWFAGILFFFVVSKAVPQFQDLAGTVSLTINPWSVFWVLFAGLSVTMVSAVVPAFKAALTKPIEALRDVAVDRSARGRIRAGIGIVLLGFGAVLLLVGAIIQNFWVIMGGPVFLFLGVLFGGPMIAATFGWIIDRIPGVGRFATSRLGVENVRRNPKRAATTANALVIGVFLVVFVTAAGGALRDYAVNQLSQLTGPDFTVYPTTPSGFSDDYLAAVQKLPDVSTVGEAFIAGTMATGSKTEIGALNADGVKSWGFKVQEGTLDGFGGDDIAVPSYFKQTDNLALGSTVTLTFGNGRTHDFTVSAITEASATQIQAFVPSETAVRVDPALRPAILGITADSGKVDAVNDELTKLNRTYSGVQVFPGNFIAQFVKSFFNFLISAVSALLSVAVVIALFGIVNTLVLSVSERTHEIGLLRAVGMTRRQVRSTVRVESLVVSLLGSIVGIVFGLFVAWCFARPVLNQAGEVATGFSWPIVQLVVILVLGVILGVIASLIPAWRAARLNIIEAVRVD